MCIVSLALFMCMRACVCVCETKYIMHLHWSVAVLLNQLIQDIKTVYQLPHSSRSDLGSNTFKCN